MRAAAALDGPLGPALAPLGWLWSAVSRLRAAAWRRGLFRAHRPPMPVLSLGNLAAGGTGKTPLLLDTVARLERRGFRAGVLSRGYGGDEGRILRRRHPDCLLAEDPDRVRALQQFLAVGPPEILLLDDGFQHFRLERDLDVVLIDATRPFGRCLPAGLFREPPAALRRADLVVLSRAELVPPGRREEIWRRVEAVRSGLPPLPRIEGGVRAAGLRSVATGAEEPPAAVAGRRWHLAAGIGNPDSFRALVERLGGEVASTEFRPDHHAWTRAEIEAWAGRAPVLVTEKDAVKLQGETPDEVWELRVDWVFARGEEEWETRLDGLVLPVRAARIEPLWSAVDPRGGQP